MSLKSHPSRKVLALAGVAACAALGAAASPASAANLSVKYSCTYPLLQAQPLRIDIAAEIPTGRALDEGTGAIAIKAIATAGGNTWNGLSLIGAKTIEGTAVAGATVVSPDGFKQGVVVDINVAKYNIPATNQDLLLNATGTTPSLFFDQAGVASLTVDSLDLNLKVGKADGTIAKLPLVPGTTDSDGDPETFDVNCKADPVQQEKTLANIQIAGPADTQAPSNPSNVTGDTASSSINASWNAATDNVAVNGYDVFVNGVKTSSSANAATTIGGLKPSTTYRVKVQAKDAKGNFSGFSSEASFTTLAAGNDGGQERIPYGFGLKGTANILTLTRGPVPIKGDIAADLALSTGDYVADLKLNNARGSLQLLGLIPVTADVQFINTERTKGSLKNGVLTANAKLKIRLAQLYLFGAVPIADPGKCTTKTASNIVLKSTESFFDPLKGGPISGRFAISDLSGCGPLNGFISPLAAGGGNTINATLAPVL